MSIVLTKRDVFWGYFAQFFSMASGIIVLPLVLRMLTPEEIGMNYLMLTVGSMVSLFDFGFAPQFGRNISYIFSGAQVLKKEGVEINENHSQEINYKLLSTMIHTARYVYQILAIVALLVMLSFGTLYIFKVTNGFENVNNSLIIWIVYSLSTFFNIYYTYYTSLLTGKGLIKESKKAMVYSKIAYITFIIIFLLLGLGLLGVAIANLLSPFVGRVFSKKYFFTVELKDKINQFTITPEDKSELFKIIWYNSKKLGLVFIGSYAISKFGMFLAGLYLSLKEVSSYGLMIQLVGIIVTIAGTLFTIYNPKFAELKVKNNKKELLKTFSYSMGVYYSIFLLGSLMLIFLMPGLLVYIKSNALLPATGILILYLLVTLLERNHSIFSSIIVIGNTVPFVRIALISGGLIALLSYISLSFTTLGILGLVLAQGVVQLAYNNWKWPLVVCRDFEISVFQFVLGSFTELFKRIKLVL